MSSFTDTLSVRYIDGREWELLTPFHYDVGEENSGDRITVPAGLVTDFASIPRLFWVLELPTGNEVAKAAIIHDHLYVSAHNRTRKECDKIFREGMAVLGAPLWKRWLFYWAVRLGGWAYWIPSRRKLKTCKGASR